MFSTKKDDDMVECPYNKYHQMTRRRLIPHLIKCRLSFPDAELIKCPFNASHLIPEPEFTHHVSNCKDKAIIHQYKYNTLPVKLDVEDRNQVEIDCDENWDDTDAVDYDPKKYVEQANVIRTHIGDLPSARKEFRKNERKRLGDEDSSDEESFRKRVYKDMDCRKKEEPGENNWFEDRGPSSSSRSSSKSKSNYKESLNEFPRERFRDEDYPKKIIKIESSDSEEDLTRKRRDSSPKRKRDEDDLFRRRQEEDSSKKRRDSSPKQIINIESSGSEEDLTRKLRDSSPQKRREEDDLFKRRGEEDSSNKRRDYSPERRREEDDSVKERDEMYPLDEDPYYRTQNTRSGFLGMSRGSRRKHY